MHVKVALSYVIVFPFLISPCNECTKINRTGHENMFCCQLESERWNVLFKAPLFDNPVRNFELVIIFPIL